MIRSYEKGTGDRSVRIETEYRCNEAGAKQYILDQIKLMDSYTGNQLDSFCMVDSRVTGALLALVSIGLIDVFDLDELKTKKSLSFNRFLDRLSSPVEQI